MGRERARRVLIYGMNFAPELTGVGKFTGELAGFLADDGVELVTVTTPPHYPGWQVLAPYRNRYSVERDTAAGSVYRCPLLLRKKMGGIWRLLAPMTFAMTSAPVFLWQVIRRRPRVIICVEPTLMVAPLALLLAWVTRARTVLHVQDLEVDAAFQVGHLRGEGFGARMAFRFERFLLRRFHRIISISNAMLRRLEGKGVAPERLQLVRNWVDTDEIRPLAGPNPYRASLGFSADDFVALYSGNLGAKQGLDVLLDAAERLSDTPGLRFVVAGEGPEKAGLEERYGQLPNVTFLPLQPRETFNSFLNLADAHVLVQRADAADLVLPSKVAAMLASGRPVVVTAAPGTELADFLEGSATIIPPGEPDMLADALRSLAAMQADRRPTARPEAVQAFSAVVARHAFTAAIGQLA